MNPGISLAFASLFLMIGTVVWTNVVGPFPPRMERAVAFAGTALAGFALALDPGAIGYAIAGVALATAAFFFLLTFMSGLPAQRSAVSVGHPAPDFESRDAEGGAFRLADLRGSRVLLKFFRGAWCPYCVADLRAWNERREELRSLGLELVAVSHDSVDELRRLQRRHDLDMILVGDPGLAIIRRYNLQNRNFTPKRGPFRDMAIPATILVDADGKVLWMEQASDFRARARPDQVLAAVRAVLAAPAAKAAGARGAAGGSNLVTEEI
jgi:peroxiredoxin